VNLSKAFFLIVKLLVYSSRLSFLKVIKICCSKIIIDVIIEYISKINSTMQTEALFEKHCHPNSRRKQSLEIYLYCCSLVYSMKHLEVIVSFKVKVA
jgi:hypothetical protein